MKFTDRVTLQVVAGKGGNGVVAWRREKFIPKGGPTGGNGGKGGSIIIQADNQVYSLEWFRNRRILKAENGMPGADSDRQGRSGENLVLKVPCGTLVKDAQTGEVLFDLTEHKQKIELCVGGRGGKGNGCFATPTNRAPNIWTPGLEGEVKKVEFELKLIADVGLVGYPNAGKSTLISAIADVRVKIAPYPFTTLQPNLGFIQKEDYTRLFIADIPGIIEGAHRNKGLGFEFLRHIDRTKLLIYMLDASGIDGRNPVDDFNVLRAELKAYNCEMLDRPYMVVLNKIDADDAELNIEIFYEAFANEEFINDPLKLFKISAQRGDGLKELVDAIKLLPSSK